MNFRNSFSLLLKYTYFFSDVFIFLFLDKYFIYDIHELQEQMWRALTVNET